MLKKDVMRVFLATESRVSNFEMKKKRVDSNMLSNNKHYISTW